MLEKNINKELHFLRALSILLVIFFHFNILNFTGGFIGVDIFFVISGFLITSIILEDNKFNFYNFFLKRFKRIYPLILLIVLISLFLGNLIFSPLHMERLIDSSSYTIFGISNIFFFKESGYFDQEKLFKPLLHTWSLSVELQYYIFWPFIIFFIKRFFLKNIFNIVLSIFIISLVASFIYSSRTDAFFYFTGFRLYEFCIGTIAYLIIKKKNIKSNLFYFYLGLSIIFFSAFFFNEDFDFPGINALLPCLGAFLIIIYKIPVNNHKSFFINNFTHITANLSYTIYIVHWPALIFFSYQFMHFPNQLEKIFLLILIFLLSQILNKYYENPLRKFYFKEKFLKDNFKLTGIFVFTLLSILYLKGNFENFNKRNFFENNVINQVFKDREKKNAIEDEILQKLENIKIEKIEENSFNLVIGDSHAFDFYLALKSLEETEDKLKLRYYNFDYFYCFNEQNYKDKIINFLNYSIFKRKNSCNIAISGLNYEYIDNAKNLIVSSRWNKKLDTNSLSDFLKNFSQNKIIVTNGHRFYDIPTLYFKTKKKINNFAINFLNEEDLNLENFQNMKNQNLKIFNKSKLNCKPNCIVFKDNHLLYSDKDHWSLKAMNFFGKRIEKNKFFDLMN